MNEGIEMTTVYAFSTENWNRDSAEVTALMTIFTQYAEVLKKEALQRNIKINVLSTDASKLPIKVQHVIEDLQQSTLHGTQFVVNICLSYGGRSEIVQACRSIVTDFTSTTSELKSIDDITEEQFAKRLATANLPDPDLLIRTSGEYRLSNFLLWQVSSISIQSLNFCEYFG